MTGACWPRGHRSFCLERECGRPIVKIHASDGGDTRGGDTDTSDVISPLGHPDLFLRHSNWKLQCDPVGSGTEFNGDATFRCVRMPKGMFILPLVREGIFSTPI